ncbi:MAG: sulfite exporter TauE/SafE family protein [Oceanospirillaceae bacterium]|nr:sulfite exporter TauE/SafE family protein [Oceanospirillaceae bacterium]
MENLAGWLPAALGPAEALLLVALSGLTSMITAALGIGGGVLLLAVMASMLPVSALIPVHGLVQLGSNFNRALMTCPHIDWVRVRPFAVGALLGALVATLVLVQLPLTIIQLSVAGFILYLLWGPGFGKGELSRPGLLAMGVLTTLVSMFVGATGPLVAAWVHRLNAGKFSTVATFAACMSVQHLLKLAVFSTLGFLFVEWLPLIVAMIGAGAVGTWAGLKLLDRMPPSWFRPLFRLIVTLLALRLIWQSVAAA